MSKHKHAYQSPISLHFCGSFPINERLKIHGENCKAYYNCKKKIFEVKDDVILSAHSKKYKLHEYHFHVPCEHEINDKKFAAELHYVFIECSVNECESTEPKKYSEYHDVCGCDKNQQIDENILVIGRVIKNTNELKDLETIQVDAPCDFFEYDGTLTTGTYSPVRWIVGEHQIKFNIHELCKVAKDARPLQDFDGRIVLFSDKK